jgi:hypothetical protein
LTHTFDRFSANWKVNRIANKSVMVSVQFSKYS